MRELLDETVRRAARFLESLAERPVAAALSADGLATALGGALPKEGLPAAAILSRLDEVGEQGAVASAGPRYFGFVTGGVLPAPLAANWLAAAWDQNAFSEVSSPVGAAVEPGRGAMAAGGARPAGRCGDRVCDRGDDGELRRACRRPPRGAARARP